MAENNKLRLQLAMAIQSDEKGKGYFTTEQQLSEFLSLVLKANKEEALHVAREILEDRDGSRYYYFEPGGPETLAGRLAAIGQAK
jgi:hypothetical protein